MNYLKDNFEYLAYSLGYTTRQLCRLVRVPCSTKWLNDGNPGFSYDTVARIQEFVTRYHSEPWEMELFYDCLNYPLSKMDVVRFSDVPVADFFRTNLRPVRYFTGITADSLAKMAHVHMSTITNIELGHMRGTDAVRESISLALEKYLEPNSRGLDIYERAQEYVILNRIPRYAHARHLSVKDD